MHHNGPQYAEVLCNLMRLITLALKLYYGEAPRGPKSNKQSCAFICADN